MRFKFWEKRGLEIEGAAPPDEQPGEMLIITGDGTQVSSTMDADAFTTLLSTGRYRPMSRDTALSMSAVYSCIDRIASNIAMIPVSVRQVTDTTNELVSQHPAAYLLGTKPNDWQTPYMLKQGMMCDLLTNGNTYVQVESTRRGEALALNWFDARSVGLYNTGKRRWTYQATDDEGYNYTFFPDELIHVRALGNKGRKGLSPIQLHAELINMGLDAEDYGATFFGAGGKPSGIVGIKGDNINDDSMNRVTDAWKRSARMVNGNKVIFLPADVTYSAIGVSPVDANLVQMLKLTRSEIAGIYNVPGYLIGDIDKAPANNITAQSISFVRNTLQPWITALEEEMNIKLFMRSELEKGLRVHFDMDALIRGTPVERAQINHYAITDGWKNRNTVRVEEGYSRVDGQGLDDYVISVNAVKAGDKSLQNGDNAMNPNGDNIGDDTSGQNPVNAE